MEKYNLGAFLFFHSQVYKHSDSPMWLIMNTTLSFYRTLQWQQSQSCQAVALIMHKGLRWAEAPAVRKFYLLL